METKARQNNDIPAEVIVKYVVSDYQRMFGERDGLLKEIHDLKKKNVELSEKIHALNSELCKWKGKHPNGLDEMQMKYNEACNVSQRRYQLLKRLHDILTNNEL